MNVISFDIGGDFALFKKSYTTTSPLTFSFPPRTAILGIIGAIVGIDRTELPSRSTPENVQVTSQILNPVQKMQMAINHLNTKSNAHGRTQINHEFIKNPKYRIYVHTEDVDLDEKLNGYLNHGKTHFIPYLGQQQCLATISNYHKRKAIEKKSSDYIPIVSVVRKPVIKSLDITDQRIKDENNMPHYIGEKRSPMAFDSYLFEETGKEMNVRLVEEASYVQVEDENILWM